MDLTCEQVGLPFAPEKSEGPSQTITFLGVELDSSVMIARLPQPKLEVIASFLAWQKGGLEERSPFSDWSAVSCW